MKNGTKNLFNFFLQLSVAVLMVLGLSLTASAQDNNSAKAADPGPDAVQDRTPKKKTKFIELMVGIQKDIKLPDLPKDVKFQGDFKDLTSVQMARGIKTLRFNPKKVGVGTLTIHDSKGRVVAEYRVDVKKSNLTKVVREMRSLLGDIEGISIKVVNNKVVVDGQILLPKDMSRIYAVVRQFSDVASSIVSLSPLAQKKIAEFIERDINNPEIHVRAVNDRFILEGMANSEEDKQRAEIVAKMYVPDYIVDVAEVEGAIKKRKVDSVINLIKLKPMAPAPPRKIIQLIVHYVELKKDYTRGFRFQWTPDLADGSSLSFKSDSTSSGGVVSSITGTISNLLPKLNWAKQHGHARVLQSTSLIVQDSKKGNLRSVQKIPYPIISQDGQAGTAFAEVGIRTAVTPTVLGPRSDSIQLEMDFSLSSYLGNTDAGPLTSDSQLQTVIVVRSGQSAAVGGLITNNANTNYNKLPKNSSANPLLSLYASKDFARNQSQFVVFITPVIKSSASAGSERIKRKFRLRE